MPVKNREAAGQHLDAGSLNRRQLLKGLSLVLGALPLQGLSPDALLAEGRAIHKHIDLRSAGTQREILREDRFFTPHQFQTVDVICEAIIPQTTTAGSRAAKVPAFIDALLATRESKMQEEIVEGLSWLDQRSRELWQNDFIEVSPELQLELLTRISSPNSSEDRLGTVLFDLLKSLTVFGYYTSREGLEQELGYVGPMGTGSYEGSVPVEKSPVQ